MSNGISLKGIVAPNGTVHHFDHEYLENNPPIPEIDTGLDTEGEAADAAVTGNALDALKEDLNAVQSDISSKETLTGNYHVISDTDYTSAKANADVIVGNRNMVALESNDVVGQTYINNGITRVRNADDSYTISGTATRNESISICSRKEYFPSGNYILSGCPARGEGQTYVLYADYFIGSSRSRIASDTGENKTGTLPDNYDSVTIYFSIPSGTVIDTPITLRPQFERGSVATEYVKSANTVVAAGTSIPIDGTVYIFDKASFELEVSSSAIPQMLSRIDALEDGAVETNEAVEGLSNDVDDVKADVTSVTDDLLNAYPQITVAPAQMVDVTDGGDNVPVKSMTVNIDYASTARSKIRTFVSSENMFNLDDVITKRFITKNDDGSLTPSGTVSIYSGVRSAAAPVPSEDFDRLPFLPAGDYYITADIQGAIYLSSVDASDGSVTTLLIHTDHSFTVPTDSMINICISGTASNIIITNAPHDEYAPNKGKTYVVPFVDTDGNDFTVYGGMVDIINGIVTELYDSTGSELATPVTHNITPVPVKTVLGYNHIWSDANSVSVTYRADVKDYVDQRNLSEMLNQYNIDASKFGNIRVDSFMGNDSNVVGIAHRGLSQTHPENTMPAFKAAANAGFSVVETDIEWTSDGIPVLLHDSTINRTARNADGSEISTTISIRDITLAQALEYDFGIWKGEEFAGTKIPTFAEFILFCKRAGLHPQIELKFNNQTMEQTMTILQMVIANGMINRVWWVSNFKNLLLQVLSVHQGACVVLVMTGYNETRWNDLLEIREKYPTANIMLACGYDYMSSEELAQVIGDLKAMGVAMGIWTINNSNTIKNLDPYITGVTSNILNASEVLKDYVLNDV